MREGDTLSLPKGWEIKKLSEIGKVFNGNSINEKVKKDKYTNINEGLPFIATKDVGFDSEIDYENDVRIPFHEKNQFKIAPSRTPLICAEGGSAGRKIGFTNQDVCFGNKLFALVPNKNVDSKFVFYYYFTSSFQKHFLTEMAGIIGGVSMNKFKEIEIPFPPLPEQQHIVSILDEAFTAIAKAKANAEQNLKNAKELFDSYLQGVFEEKGDDWEEVTLSELFDVKHGFAFQGEYFTQEGEYVLLTPGNFFEEGGYRDRGEKQKYFVGEIPSDFILKKGDLLVAMTEQAAGLLGSPILVPESDKFLHNQRLGLIIPKQNVEIDNEFFFHVFNLKRVRKDIHDSGTGVKVRHTSPTKIGQVKISYPKSIKEQQTIIRKLDALRAETQKLEALYQKKIADLEELKKSILQKAFSGELGGREVGV